MGGKASRTNDREQGPETHDCVAGGAPSAVCAEPESGSRFVGDRRTVVTIVLGIAALPTHAGVAVTPTAFNCPPHALSLSARRCRGVSASPCPAKAVAAAAAGDAAAAAGGGGAAITTSAARCSTPQTPTSTALATRLGSRSFAAKSLWRSSGTRRRPLKWRYATTCPAVS